MGERKRIRTTKYSRKAGGASKFAPGDLERRVERDGVGEEALLPLFDPATSGGPLVAAPEDGARERGRLLHQERTSAAVVGEGAGVWVTA